MDYCSYKASIFFTGWFGTFFYFSVYWEESSQLTNSEFSEGWKPPTSDIMIVDDDIMIMSYISYNRLIYITYILWLYKWLYKPAMFAIKSSFSFGFPTVFLWFMRHPGTWWKPPNAVRTWSRTRFFGGEMLVILWVNNALNNGLIMVSSG